MWPPKTPWFLEKAEAGVALMSLSVTEGSVRAISVLNARSALANTFLITKHNFQFSIFNFQFPVGFHPTGCISS